jgi:hypothetical protein
LDVPQQDTPHLKAEIINLYASIQQASYQLIKLIAEFDGQGHCWQEGFKTTATWLGYYLGMGANAAREKVRVARALQDLPVIDAAFSEGRLSYSKVRALTRLATAKDEALLVSMAEHASAHQVERIVRDQIRLDRGRPEVSTRPELVLQRADNGDVIIKGRLPKELGALLQTALNIEIEKSGTADAGSPPPANQPISEQRAYALLELVQAKLSDQTGSSADRYLVHIDFHDPDLSQAALDRLTCDGSVVVHSEGHDENPSERQEEPSAGPKTRTIPSALRRALRKRDRGCCYPGCTHTRFVDAHHVHHWARGGATKLNNLILLCRRHHTFIHEGRARIQIHHPQAGAVEFHFYTQDGQRLRATGERFITNITPLNVQPVANVTAVTSRQQSPLAPQNPTPRPDYHHIAWVLQHRRSDE